MTYKKIYIALLALLINVIRMTSFLIVVEYYNDDIISFIVICYIIKLFIFIILFLIIILYNMS